VPDEIADGIPRVLPKVADARTIDGRNAAPLSTSSRLYLLTAGAFIMSPPGARFAKRRIANRDRIAAPEGVSTGVTNHGDPLSERPLGGVAYAGSVK